MSEEIGFVYGFDAKDLHNLRPVIFWQRFHSIATEGRREFAGMQEELAKQTNGPNIEAKFVRMSVLGKVDSQTYLVGYTFDEGPGTNDGGWVFEVNLEAGIARDVKGDQQLEKKYAHRQSVAELNYRPAEQFNDPKKLSLKLEQHRNACLPSGLLPLLHRDGPQSAR